MTKQEALNWFRLRKKMCLSDRTQEAEDIAIECIASVIAQEPRVLALKEVQNDCPDYVYLEWQNCCICCIKDEGESNKSVAYFVYGIEGSYFQFTWDTYGSKWRCWSAMPTEEQRKAVK